jgi:hypothetical protein
LGGGCGHLQNLDKHGASIEKIIIMAFESMYLGILNNDMVGFSKTAARDMLDHLFLSYCSITDTLNTTGKIFVKYGNHISL